MHSPSTVNGFIATAHTGHQQALQERAQAVLGNTERIKEMTPVAIESGKAVADRAWEKFVEPALNDGLEIYASSARQTGKPIEPGQEFGFSIKIPADILSDTFGSEHLPPSIQKLDLTCQQELRTIRGRAFLEHICTHIRQSCEPNDPTVWSPKIAQFERDASPVNKNSPEYYIDIKLKLVSR